MNKEDQFYSYAIFISITTLFFAILAIFYSYMENGLIFPTLTQINDKEHIFQWMKDTENKVEPIVDLTYRDNKALEQSIDQLGNSGFIHQAQLGHIQELSEQNGQPYPVLYYIEPFEDSGSLQNSIQKFIENDLFQGNGILPNNTFDYESGKKFAEKFGEMYNKIQSMHAGVPDQ